MTHRATSLTERPDIRNKRMWAFLSQVHTSKSRVPDSKENRELIASNTTRLELVSKLRKVRVWVLGNLARTGEEGFEIE